MRDSDREWSEFLLRASHDLRAPLRAVRAHAELLLKRGALESASENLHFIADGAQRIEALANGLSRYALALQTGGCSFQTVSIGALVRSALAKLEKELSESHPEVTYHDLPRVTGNPDRLMEVFENLLRNAIQYRGEASPAITITAERSAAEWLLAVRDNGRGMEAAYLEKIFKPLERLNGEERGAGLGLTICRAIIERHGGKIWANSELGHGSQFYFTLPAG